MTENTDYKRNKLIASLMQIGHGDLKMYTEIGLQAMKAEPELFAHFITWNAFHGKVRDAKVAFAALGLRHLTKDDRELAENAIANAMRLSPRKLIQFYDYSKSLSGEGHIISGGWRRLLESALRDYLAYREATDARWDKVALQHRRSLKRIYRFAHRRPPERAQNILFGLYDDVRRKPGKVSYPDESVFQAVAMLRTTAPQFAASLILHHRIPFEVVVGAASKAHDETIILALIENMTGNQLITNSKMLQKLGVNTNETLKAAYAAAIERAKKAPSRKVETLKAGRAAEEIEDEEMAAQLMSLQQTKVRQLAGIEGDWAILADASGSMHQAIEIGRKIASLLTEKVKGAIHLIFFDTVPTHIVVTGLTYDQIVEKTKRIKAGGGTAIGCGLDYLRAQNIIVNGIAIISDGGDNTVPYFHDAYQKYERALGMDPTVYLYHVNGDERDALSNFCKQHNIQLEKFELGDKVDYYSLPGLIATMRTNRFSLVQEIMETPLLRLEDVFRKEAA